MSSDRGRGGLTISKHGYQPGVNVQKGYQPLTTVSQTKPQGGHQPTSQGRPAGPPPNQGSSGKPSK